MQDGHSRSKSSAQPLASNVVRLRPFELPEALEPLMNSDRWVLWKYRKRKGEITKPPYYEDDKLASTRDEGTWLSYREVVRSFKDGWAEGIGFNIGDGIGAIDLDQCYVGGVVVEWAHEIIDQTKSYVEVTPSGHGLRVIGFTRGGKVHTNRKRGEGKLELYRGECGRYITISGNQFRPCAGLVSIDELIDKLANSKDADNTPSGVFFRMCANSFDRGKSDAWIEQQIETHPQRWKDSAAGRYVEADRLAGEIGRCRERWEANNPEKAERQTKDTSLKQKGKIVNPLELMTSSNAIEARDPDFEWHPYIIREEMFWICSKGGVGKGLMCADIVARMTTGNKWPLSRDRADKGNVLWFESEDNPATTLKPRLIAAGADLDRVFICERDPSVFWAWTTEQLKKHDIGMIVLSPLLSYMNVDNFRDEIQVREALEAMSNKIRGISCSITGLLHPSKKADLGAVERVLGSQAFVTFVRSLAILRDEGDGIARMAHVKYNNSVKGPDLLFVKSNREPVKHARGQYIGIEWLEAEGNVDENEALVSVTKEEDKGAPAWLTRFLDDHRWHSAEEVLKAGDKMHFTEVAIKKAKLRNRKIEDEPRGWPAKRFWRLKR